MATKNKKKFSETKVGAFLSKAAPGILGTVGDVLPDQGVLGMVKNLIHKEPDTVLPPEDKEKAMKLLEIDMIEMQEVSKRWDSDMKSDSWLSKNTRPMSLIFLTVSACCCTPIVSGTYSITFAPVFSICFKEFNNSGL